MNPDDFRCMWRGRQLSILKKADIKFLQSVELRSEKKHNALLLLHGFSSSPAVFRQLLSLFPQYDAIILPVLPGHVANIEAFASIKASEWLSFAEEICEKLLQEFKELDVLGLSLGGLLACHLSARFKLNHLYLLAPSIDLHLAINKIIPLAKCLNWLGFKRMRSLAGNLYTPMHCEIAYRQLPLTTVIETLGFIQNFEFVPPTCKTDVFLGRFDEVVVSEHVAERFKNISTTNIHWLDNSAHVLPLDGDIQTIIDCMKKNRELNSAIM